MEIWKDLTTGKYYTLDEKSGSDNQSNRYGGPTTKFIPYKSGYPRALSLTPLAAENIYSVQPHKFDGYSQFPRPKVISSLKEPYTNTFINKKIKIQDLVKIPMPLKHLSMSAVYDKSITPPKLKFNNKHSIDLMQSPKETLEYIKQTELLSKRTSEIKTVIDLNKKLLKDRKTFKPYVPKLAKEERRKMKGYFMKDFITSGQLMEKEKEMRKITNSKFFERIKHWEMLDRKNLEKRKEQRIARMNS
ncbi:hypothetical protein SteCoe_25275 [Stentor coeruleus]|uniref:Uncharacterized protein n=1 Tax=Stentor coeruleus TaxID=5963 RepID=A0A1R2BFM6_9CILI|nr:hypothetical protein SteCoe_25275 [Stentor coeruleus]